MSEAAGPPPITPSGNSNKTMLRNIITGVITTVIGGGLIWFLGFHNSSSNTSSAPDYLVVKDATMNGWKSYVSAENVFWGNWNVDAANYSNMGFDRYKENTLGELQRFRSDMQKILETKNLDPSFSSLLTRRTESKQEWEDRYRKHLDNYENIDKSISDQAERTQKLNAEIQRFTNETKVIDQRFANEIDELCKVLTSKYSYDFSWKELKMYQQAITAGNNNTTTTTSTQTDGITTGTSTANDGQKLIGKWQMLDKGKNMVVGTLFQYEDGRMYYYFQSGDSTYGKWQYNNGQLTLYYLQYWGAGQNFVYDVSNITDNGFLMKLANPPTEFAATRSN